MDERAKKLVLSGLDRALAACRIPPEDVPGARVVLGAGADVAGMAPGASVAVLRARHASVMTVPAAWVVPVPAGVELRDAALVYLAVIAGYGVRRAGPIAGEPLCVIGTGPIGALA